LRHRLDAVLIGVGTLLEDNPQLTYRGRSPKGRPLIRVVLDSRLRTPPASRIFDESASPVLLYCDRFAPSGRRRALERRGAEIIPVPRSPGGISLEHVLRDLGERAVLGVVVEGGSAVNWSFLSQGRVDKLILIVAPLLLGGGTALPAVGGEGFADLESATRLRITRVRRTGDDCVLEAYPRESRSLMSPWPRPEALPSSGRSVRRPSPQK
jgi:diaminohydroxyphosphoribosylaminopyrimidine deaminase/5-amino-6-(5-phosphoribosylamino)uracil reductase